VPAARGHEPVDQEVQRSGAVTLEDEVAADADTPGLSETPTTRMPTAASILVTGMSNQAGTISASIVALLVGTGAVGIGAVGVPHRPWPKDPVTAAGLLTASRLQTMFRLAAT
jgi:hypothetical protein